MKYFVTIVFFMHSFFTSGIHAQSIPSPTSVDLFKNLIESGLSEAVLDSLMEFDDYQETRNFNYNLQVAVLFPKDYDVLSIKALNLTLHSDSTIVVDKSFEMDSSNLLEHESIEMIENVVYVWIGTYSGLNALTLKCVVENFNQEISSPMYYTEDQN